MTFFTDTAGNTFRADRILRIAAQPDADGHHAVTMDFPGQPTYHIDADTFTALTDTRVVIPAPAGHSVIVVHNMTAIDPADRFTNLLPILAYRIGAPGDQPEPITAHPLATAPGACWAVTHGDGRLIDQHGSLFTDWDDWAHACLADHGMEAPALAKGVAR